LALDHGLKRTGVALSDELGMFAHPRPALVGLQPEALLASIAEFVAAESVAEVIVGVPTTLAGGNSEQTRAVRAFIAALRKRLSVPVSEADERLSSVQAGGALGVKDRKRTGTLDSAAAAVVLQSVLDARASGATR
jgi:putative holliday junction resolvase